MAGLVTVGYIFAALLMLGVLITMHEAGHYFAARWCGIEVKEFGIGMGPKIWSRRGKSGTLFSLRVLPIGGFCMYYGEDEENADPRAYNNQAVWKRFISILAGPAMNVVVGAVIALILVFAWGVQVPIPTVGALEEKMPAAAAGLLPGDKIVSIEGIAVEDATRARELISAGAGKPISIVVRRGEETLTFSVTPRLDEASNSFRIGIYYANARKPMSVGESISYAFSYCKFVVVETYTSLYKLITQGQGAGDVSGPVGIVNVIQQETRTGGLPTYLNLAVLISINLGFMNMLPIPGLDGSRLIFCIVEAVRRKPINRNVEGMIHFMGVVLLFGVMLLFTYRDIGRLFGAG